jgi:hypothetical protein
MASMARVCTTCCWISGNDGVLVSTAVTSAVASVFGLLQPRVRVIIPSPINSVFFKAFSFDIYKEICVDEVLNLSK